MRNKLIATLAAALLLAGLGPLAHAQGDKPKDLAQRGDAQCTRCHDQDSEFPVLAIGTAMMFATFLAGYAFFNRYKHLFAEVV